MYSLVRTPTPFRLRVRPRALDRTFDDLVDSFFSPSLVRSSVTTPVVTSAWQEGALTLAVDLPGIPRDAVDISVAGRALTIVVKTDGLSWERSLTLGASLDPEQVTAQYADGRLTITVGPVAEAQPRRIEIDTASTANTASTPALDTGDQPEGEQDTSTTA